jgi:hypothetical protein
MKKKQEKKPEVCNNTPLSLDQVAALPILGRTRNNWRQRDIVLHAHPTDGERLISVGTTFDGMLTVIGDEPKSDWAIALDYAAHGKVYVRD